MQRALGARGLHALQSYGLGEPVPVANNNAYTLTSINNDGQLKRFTSHPVPLTRSRYPLEYHTMQLRSFAIIDMPNTFREGAAAYRNARD